VLRWGHVVCCCARYDRLQGDCYHRLDLGGSRQDVQLRTLLCLLHVAQLWGINFSFSTLGSFCVGSPISQAARALGAFCWVCWSLLVQKPKMRLPLVLWLLLVCVFALSFCAKGHLMLWQVLGSNAATWLW
jgi:hypothetical protein